MARMEIALDGDFCADMAKICGMTEELVKEALYAGVAPVADAVRRELESLPTEHSRRLRKGEMFDGVPKGQQRDLLASLGITPIKLGRDGKYTVKVGFDGYGSRPTKAYPKGLPNALLARSIESGSSVRIKNPFITRAVRKSKADAVSRMQEAFDNKIKLIMEDKS